MKHYRIIRLSEDSKNPQIGCFLVDGIPRFMTLEPPVVGDIVCIPEGEYICKKVFARRTIGGLNIKITFLVKDVPGRDGILFHIGNKMDDTRGCILIAEGLRGINFISNSQIGFDNWIQLVGKEDEFELTIER